MGIETPPATLGQLTFVGLRLIGIYLVARSTYLLPAALGFLFRPTRFSSGSFGIVLSFLLTVALGIVLWAFASRLAAAVTGKSDAPLAVEGSRTLIEVEVIALSVLGIFILASALPLLIINIAELIAPNTFERFPQMSPSPSYRLGAKVLEIVGGGIRLAIGLWLVFGSQGLVAWIRRIRERARDTQFGEDEFDESED